MRRYSNGQFKSKKIGDLEDSMRLYTAVGILTLATMFGFALQPSYHVWERVEAHEPTHYCDLIVVDCVAEQSEVESEVDIAIQKAIQEIPHTSKITEKWIEYLYTESIKMGLDPDVNAHIIWCESQFWNVQSNVIYDFTSHSRGIYEGEQEKSYGVWMFHLPDHNIGYDCATDFYCATDYALTFLKNGQHIWYGHNKDTDTCTNGLHGSEYWL
jgi:sarcosine oxidase delta subunit